MAVITVQVNPNVLRLVTSMENNVSKAICEALDLWLKEKIIICPITNEFCVNMNQPCNNCEIARKSKL